MDVLALNCGSSTLKFALFDFPPGPPDAEPRAVRARGLVDAVGGEATLRTSAPPAASEALGRVPDHATALERLLGWLEASIDPPARAAVVGHRVVHGGGRFDAPTLLSDAVIEAIEDVSALAPLHNHPALEVVRATRAALGAGVPMTASFDTAFHRSMPARAANYAIPEELATRHDLRRFGFHGLAHGFMAERAAALLGRPLEELRLVTLQLGAGCSAAAVDGGRSLDTSMGLTPLEGLMMGARSGDVDPSLAEVLAEREGITAAQAVDWLNTRSGLLGVSGRSSDMREVFAAASSGDERAALAIEMFCYRVRKQVGAYLAALEGADAVVFGGGIGEHQPEVRARICARLGWAGLRLDPDRNASLPAGEGLVSEAASPIAALVVAVDEELWIAREARRLLGARPAPS
jgi:acetate kinase